VLAQFEDIVARGLTVLIEEDENLDLVASGIEHEDLAPALGEHRPNVAILNFGSPSSAAELRELHRSFPTTRLVVARDRGDGPHPRATDLPKAQRQEPARAAGASLTSEASPESPPRGTRSRP
jgi:DNA-binding NarL/FixJ family response regulator